jgi:hypothetical protein
MRTGLGLILSGGLFLGVWVRDSASISTALFTLARPYSYCETQTSSSCNTRIGCTASCENVPAPPYNAHTAATLDLLPWSWTVHPLDPSRSCPSSSSILGLFAVTNIIATVLSIFLGNHYVVQWVTRGYLGRPSRLSPLTGLIAPLGLQLGGNALIAHLIRKTDGYGDSDFTIAELTLFLAAWPRFSWIALTLLAYVDGPLSSLIAALPRAREAQTNDEEEIYRMPWWSSGFA